MRKLLIRFETVCNYAALISIFAMMCLVTAEAVSRYLLRHGIFGVYEITEQYLMVAAIYFGVCSVYRGGALVRVTFLVERLPARLKLALNYFDHIFSILVSLVLVIAAVKKALRVFVTGFKLEIWSLPLWPAYFIVPIGLFFLTLGMTWDIPRIKTGESSLFKEDTPDT